MAITLKIRISDPMLVGKAKMCFGWLRLFLIIVNIQLKIVNKQLKNENKWRPPKHILALPTWGQKCIFSELQPFELATFDQGHHVACLKVYKSKGR